MSIVWSRKKNRAGSSVEQRGGQKFHSEYTLKSDSPLETRSAVLACGLVPVYGSPHPENAASICHFVDAQKHPDNPYLWDVVADWDAVTGHRNPTEDQKQPDLRRPKWTGRFTAIPQYHFLDLNGQAFVDRAGSPFNPPPNIPIFVDEITIQRYESTLDRTADRAFQNASNTDTWNGAAAGEALIADIDFQEVYEYGAYWFLKTYKVLVNPYMVIDPKMTYAKAYAPPDWNTPMAAYYGGWLQFILNAGPMELDATNKPVPIYKGTGADRWYDGQPCPLDENGKKIDRDVNGYFAKPLVYIVFQTVKAVAFSTLNLVPPWI